ncbi:SMI1/KNR4 family protein [Roseateles sp. BYS78W]|uniref:SMI1/KNR4 family protein n=1 Tax=Pelomonas candidula TaxID=3299025 RepID=A0ABW7HBB0_9BURK
MIQRLLEAVSELQGCTVLPSRGQPFVSRELALPDDLKAFYERCGGLRLFEQSPCPFEILGPDEFEPANLAILGLGLQQDISDDWYLLARSGSQQSVSIDLHPSRLGHCYDSFWDRHAVAGSSTVIALSFSKLLQQTVAFAGRGLYWLEPGFKDLGDAYD